MDDLPSWTEPACPSSTRQGNPEIRCSCHHCRHKIIPFGPRSLSPAHTLGHRHSHSHSHQRDCCQDHPGSISRQQSTQITRAASVEGGLSRIASVQPQLFAHQRRGLVMCPEGNIQWTERPSKKIIARKFTIAAAAVPYPPLPLPPPFLLPRGPPACPPQKSRQARQADRQTGLGSAWPLGRGGVKTDGHHRR